MKLDIVEVPSINDPIKASPGFGKKRLADFKLDLLGRCEFGCLYCSSDNGNYLRMNRRPFADLTEEELGTRQLPKENPRLTFHWPDVMERLEEQLGRKKPDWGQGKTLVFSMLTDGFSPTLVRSGMTRQALELLLSRTAFRIRVLTKNSIVGTKRWIRFFHQHRDRFVVGLSNGTTQNRWAKRVEVNTSPPSQRLKAHRQLQESEIQTYGMLCPVFPDVLEDGQLEDLVDRIRPNTVETVWAEPFNDRQNWQAVRAGYAEGSFGYRWLTDVYENGRQDLWSNYAANLYERLRDKARREGWMNKLIYLLYERDITEADAARFRCLEGVLLQCKPGADGKSPNPHIAALQSRKEVSA